MKTGLLITTGVVAAGVTTAFLLDQKKGPKRRKLLKKQANRFMHEAAETLQEYSRELKPYWNKYSREFSEEAKHLSKEGIQKVESANHNGWKPSARMLGATGGALAFYGVGRRGLTGMIMRTVSLALFTRALFASR
jgi:gas vesicle protein